MIPCGYCNKMFKYQSEKVRHELSHSQQFECGVCSKKFSFISALHRHEKQHKRTEPVCCKECGRSFRDENLVKRHMTYAHSGTHVCSKCKGTFHSKIALHHHMKIHRPESQREHRCDFEGCTKSFNFAHNLLNHKLTHTNTKKYFCSICDKGFVQSNNLKLHMKTHDDSSKWLYCDIKGCNKKFSSASARKKHLSLHEKEINTNKVECPVLRVSETVLNTNSLSKEEIVQNESNRKSNEFLNNNEYLDLCEYTSNAAKEDLTDQIDTDSNDYSLGTIDIESSVRSCKAVLGCCIVTEDTTSDDACLCSQIKDTENELNCYTEANENSTNISFDRPDKVEVSNGKSPSNCDICPCSGTCDSAYNQSNIKDIDDTMCPLNITSPTDTPMIHYKRDGTIKLDVTFDIDINRQEPSKYTPMNSCRDILGKCIVSGSATIGEGCLCAKMMIDDRNANAEEIDELTPKPNIC